MPDEDAPWSERKDSAMDRLAVLAVEYLEKMIAQQKEKAPIPDYIGLPVTGVGYPPDQIVNCVEVRKIEGGFIVKCGGNSFFAKEVFAPTAEKAAGVVQIILGDEGKCSTRTP